MDNVCHSRTVVEGNQQRLRLDATKTNEDQVIYIIVWYTVTSILLARARSCRKGTLAHYVVLEKWKIDSSVVETLFFMSGGVS